MTTIIVQEELDATDLRDRLWSEAVHTWDNIVEAGKEQEALAFLNEIFCDRVPTITEINDILWFEPETIYEAIGLTSDGETPKEWTISKAELDELKHRGHIEDAKLEYIENSFYGEENTFCGEYVTLTEQDFKDNDLELSEEEIEELNDVIA
jgi:hypothetical protein